MSESIPAFDPKTGRLLPPVSCSYGRCDWLYNVGYQCAEQATWCSPTLDGNWQFKWGRICDIHKPMADALLAKAGIEAARWQRIDQQNAPDQRPGESHKIL